MKRFVVVAAIAGAILMAGGPAQAHPLGNFTINTYDGLRVSPSRLLVDHVIDMAEIPTFQQRSAIDTNHDGSVS
ncbi:MAG: nickel transporter, partial [Actinobacteria bacterium]